MEPSNGCSWGACPSTFSITPNVRSSSCGHRGEYGTEDQRIENRRELIASRTRAVDSSTAARRGAIRLVFVISSTVRVLSRIRS
jgi:hypothetical protein